MVGESGGDVSCEMGITGVSVEVEKERELRRWSSGRINAIMDVVLYCGTSSRD